jgi:hypothetical protein
MSIDFIVNGRVVSADTLLAGAPKAAKSRAEPPDQYHKGWRVMGHRPGAVEAACEAARVEFDAWEALAPTEQAAKIAKGSRAPKPWDLKVWLEKAKCKPVRSKPYSLKSAADLCAEMARKEGWTHVELVELTKGTLPAVDLARS